MKYKFRLKKKRNGKFVIQKKTFLFYETLFATSEFNNTQECVEYIHKRYNKNECKIIYDKEW